MCGRKDTGIIELALRAIAAGAASQPLAEWALKEQDRVNQEAQAMAIDFDSILFQRAKDETK